MLKDSRFKQSLDLLEVYESGMSEKAKSIFMKRKTFIDEFTPIFNQYYSDISSNVEQVGLEYESSLNNQSLLDLFELNRFKISRLDTRQLEFTEMICFYHSTSSH